MKPSAEIANPRRQPFIDRLENRPEHERAGRPTLLGRRAEVAIFRLRAGHSLIGVHGKRVGIYDTDECQRCKETKAGTMQHTLLECSLLKAEEGRQHSRFATRLLMSGLELKDFLWSTDQKDYTALKQLIQALLEHGVQI